MPTYSYYCKTCESEFELFFYIKDYITNPKCIKCNNKCTRNYVLDMNTINASIKKSDSELKTIGDLALRNSDRMSNDEKHSLYLKHNDYKDDKYLRPLPSGMSRIKKTSKIKWPGSKLKSKRKPKNG